jgi:hypothetical protein
MHRRYPYSFFVGLLVAFIATSAFAAAQELDTVRVRYNFTQGQEITYRMVTHDSVAMWDTVPRIIMAERVEMVNVRCDTILPEGFLLTMTLQSYVATETRPGVGSAVRESHPWVGREVTFLLGPTGEHISLLPYDTSAGSSPSGPFRPLLLPPLGDSITWIGASGNFNADYWLYENTFPPVRFAGTCFRVIPRRTDTLGHSALAVALSHVGRIAYAVPGSEMMNTSVVNGSGVYYLATDLGYPVGGDYEMIANLKFTLPTGRVIEGRQKLTMTYQLVEDDPMIE